MRTRPPAPSQHTLIAPNLSLDYLLFDFGGRNAAAEAARQTLIAADYTHNQAIQDVILRVEQAYYDYLDAKALLTAQAATIKERQTSLDSAEARHRAGVATIADVLQARTALSQAQLTYETIDGNLHKLQGTIATTMGVPATTPFEVGELPVDFPAQQVSDAVDVADRARRHRSSRSRRRARRGRAGTRARASRAVAGIAVTSASAPASRPSSRMGCNGSSRPTPPASRFASRSSPAFATRTTSARRRSRHNSPPKTRAASKQQVGLQVWTSYYDLQTAVKRLATSRDLLHDAQESADVAQGRYRAGIGSILDLLTAESALENARAEEVQARADWFLTVAQLAHDTGTLTPTAAPQGK